MWGTRYWAPRYWGARYWGPGDPIQWLVEVRATQEATKLT